MNELFTQLTAYAAKIIAVILLIAVLAGLIYFGSWVYRKTDPNPTPGPKPPDSIANPTQYKPGAAASTANQEQIKVNNEKLTNFISSCNDIISQYNSK